MTSQAKTIETLEKRLHKDTVGTDDDETPLQEISNSLPMKHDSDLDHVEYYLKQDGSNILYLAKELSRIGGDTPKEITKKIMYRLFSNDLGQHFSWDGAKGKRPFKMLNISQVIISRYCYPCTDCGKPYAYRKCLTYHKKYQCGVQVQFKCPSPNCPYICDLKSTLTRHIKLMHLPATNALLNHMSMGRTAVVKSLSPMTFPCGKCGKAFPYKAILIEHELYQCGKEPQFRCGKENCLYVSHFKKNVSIHIKHSHKVDYEEVLKRFEDSLKPVENKLITTEEEQSLSSSIVIKEEL